MVRFLMSKGYQISNLMEKKVVRHMTKREWLRQGVLCIIPAVRQIPKAKHADNIFLIGQCSPVLFLIFNKLHFIHPKKIFWWAFQIHGERPLKIIGIFLKALKADNIRLITVSDYEKEIYKDFFPENQILSVPYGDWENYGFEPKSDTKDYYFCGGSTNRDFKSLIENWGKENLVIVGSRINSDLTEAAEKNEKENIKIFFDVKPEEFDRLMRNAKAVILPFKNDTGASGQTVALKAMRMHKLMISQDIKAMREYVNSRTGFLIRDMSTVSHVVGLIDKLPTEDYLKRQDELFTAKFSYGAVTEKLQKELNRKE